MLPSFYSHTRDENNPLNANIRFHAHDDTAFKDGAKSRKLRDVTDEATACTIEQSNRCVPSLCMFRSIINTDADKMQKTLEKKDMQLHRL